ncbi:MAG: hypothetical protein JWP82_1650 [Humibacillus sp.]|nr:hypothetical protein [Humibacillus sp.]
MHARPRGLFATLASITLLLPVTVALAPPSAAAPATASGSMGAVVTAAADAPAPVSNLPLIDVRLSDPDPTKNDLTYLNASKDNKVKAVVNLVDGTTPSDGLTPIVDAAATIKGRGNATWAMDKKPYQLKFTTTQSPLGMATSTTWVLLANHSDPSLMRNKLSYDLARSAGLAYSPESRFVDVRITDVNGEQFLGNYLLTEKTEIGPNRVELSNPQGVLLELDQNYGTAEPFWFKPTISQRTFTLKDAVGGLGDTLTADQQAGWSQAQASLNELESLLYAPVPNWSRISAMIDVDSFVKYSLIHEVDENYDFNRSSVYFYKDGPADRWHAGPIWDCDVTKGNYAAQVWGGQPDVDYVKTTTYLRTKTHSWFELLLRNKEFVARANVVYGTLRSSIDALPARTDELKAQLAQSAELNFARWAGSRGYGPTSFDTGTANLKTWLSTRTAFLDNAYGPRLPTFRFASHVASLGWMPAVTSGMIAGTTGESRRVEAVRFQVVNSRYAGGVQGNAHVQGIGWTGWGATNAVVGTTGRGLRLEALQLRLTDQLAANLDLQYRVHVQSIGWMPWVRNGATAGTTGRSLRVEAVQIRVVTKTS